MKLFPNKFFLASVLLGFLFFDNNLVAQSVGINSSGASPDGSSMLDIASTGKGLLLPRMSAAQRDGIGSPATGLLVFVNNDSTFYYYDGTAWVPLFGDNAGWKTLGNANTSSGTNFLGTTDTEDLVIRTDNTERMRITSGGNIGIGTTAPTFQFEMHGSAPNINLYRYDNSTTGAVFRGLKARGSVGSPMQVLSGDDLAWLSFGGYDGSTWKVNTAVIKATASENFSGTANGTNLTFFVTENTNNVITEVVRIQNDGNVGIGNTSPSTILDIERHQNASTFMTLSNTTSGTASRAGLWLNSDGGAGLLTVPSSAYTGTSDWADGIVLQASAALSRGVVLFSQNRISLQSATPGTDVMTLTSASRVGISNTSPEVKLHVLGGSDAAVGSGGYLILGSTSSTNMVLDENEIMARDNGATSALQFNIDGGDVLIHGGSAASTKVTFLNDGKSGFGTGAPTEQVHVVGSIRMQDGGESAGDIMTSDVNGVASWVTPTSLGLGDGIYGGDGTTPAGVDVTVTDNIDFDGGTFFVDGTNNRVGIGSATTTNLLTLGDTESIISTNTSDGSDTKRISIGGGGTASLTRGAYLYVSGNEHATAGGILALVAGNPTTPSGNEGNIQFYTGGGVERMTVHRGGNVGIGTSSPSYLLDISSVANANLRIQGAANSDARLRLEGDRDWLLINDGDASLGTADYFHIVDNTAGASRVVINTSGQVGVGTASPNANVDIRQTTVPFNSVKTHFMTGYSGGTTNRSISLQQIGNATQANQFLMLNGGLGSTSVTNTPTFTSTFASSFGVGSFDDRLSLMTAAPGTNVAAIEALSIDNTGDVGIGTTAPAKNLDIVVADDVENTGLIIQNTDGHIELENGTGTANNFAPRIEGVSRGSGQSGLWLNGQIGSSDDAGTSPVVLFEAQRNTPAAVVTRPLFQWRNNGTELMTMAVNGNLGIGLSAPTAILEAKRDQNADTWLKLENANSGTNSRVGILMTSDAGSGLIGATSSGYTAIADWQDGLLIAGNSTLSRGVVMYSQNKLSFQTVAAGTDAMTILNTGDIGIGTTTPGGQLELSLDEGRKPGTNTWTVVSDARLKNITGSYDKGLNELNQLNPITYKYKNAGEREFNTEVLNQEFVGFTAQEVQKVFPEAVGTDEDGYLNLNIQAILVAYLNAIKELKLQNEVLKKEMESQKLKNTEQQELIDQLMNR